MPKRTKNVKLIIGDRMSSILLTIASLVISILLFVVFYSKKAIKNSETTLYSILLRFNLVYCLTDLITFIISRTTGVGLTLELFQKVQLVEAVIFTIILYIYEVFILDFSDKTKKGISIFSAIVGVLISIGILISPIKIDLNGYAITCSGLAYKIMLYAILVYLAFIIVYIARIYIKTKQDHNKAMPFAMIVILYAISLLFSKYITPVFVQSFIFTFTLLVMYFTIENPDAKLVEKLEEAKKEAERANTAKTDFLTKVSHEVRTPLNAIVGFAATLDEVETLEEARENSQYIVSASKNILELVNGLLDISKIEENKVEVVNTEYSFYQEIDEIIKYIEPRINGKQIVFKRTIARDLPKVLIGDKNKIKDIITNLLNNALEYTKEGYIDLNVSCINKDNISSLVITVEDSGVGISQKNVEKLFDKYSKFDDDINNNDASGLELSITKSLVELLGGKIIVQTAQGAGTKFTVYLNQEISDKQELVTQTEEVESVEEVDEEEEIEDDSALNLTGKKILVVDDNNLNLKVAVNFIKEYGAEIDTCTSGNECVSFINEGKVYDIIFMDDMMPKLSGTETLHILQQIPSFNQKVIVLTANSIEGVRDKYLEAGFEDYLSKPIIKMELERILRKHLNNNAQKVIFDPDIVKDEDDDEEYEDEE